HAIDQGVRVINLSLTYFQTPTSPEVTGLLQKIKDNNVMVVWSAGNEYGIEKPFPSNVDNILSISSVDPMLRLSDFSNQGLSTDFAAPSDIQIHSLREEKFSGTSGAAPVVSGVILNMLKVNPALSPIQIKNILKATALDLGPDGFDPQTGWGMPNMAKALLAARYVKEGRLFVSQRSIEDPTELNRLGRRVFIEISKDKRVLPISFEEAVAQSKNCEDYGKNIKKIFMNYFLTEDSTEICKFYTRHKIFLSAITFCPASQQEALKKQLALELWSSDSKRRQEAAYAVGIAQDVASLPKLTALLQDPDSDVRDLALRALGHFPHSPDAATALMRAFPTLSLGEKKAAINSLSKFETHPPAIQFLMSLVSEPLPEENNVLPRLIKEEAIKALGRLKHRESIPILIEQFASEYTLHPVTIEALAQMKEEAIPLLLETLRDIRKRPVEEPHKIEMGIGKTLGAIGAPAIEPILQAVRRKELDVFLVSNAIREIGMPALTPMLSVLEDSDPLVQWVAAKSLGDIGDDRAVEALIQKLHTRNISIQQAVRMSLERIEILTQNEQVRQRIHRALR
ncbi:MAG: HEAT repeat domain-containing protein, partial [Deltaproteobacteria bacterium]|nr:HEAT repeat domain-containing protein [Deltaproteobacteria bacterium]